MQRMKQLARSAVYWPRIDADIMDACKQCSSCAEHQNQPAKAPLHPWMIPEKPWSRIHIDHAINFLGSNWLVIVDAYSKYPCIHPTTSTSSKRTTELLEQDFAHFGYPHTIVSDNASTFKSEEFQSWCRDRGIVHLSGAPYHPATNGAAERLVQSFKQALRKSNLPPNLALTEFLMHYRRTPLIGGYSPSELLNGRQIRCKIDVLLPSPAHQAQGRQSKEVEKSTDQKSTVSKVHTYTVGSPCYALYCGPRRDREPRWVPAIVTKVLGPRSINVKVTPRGPIWRRHIEQLLPRYGVEEDSEPADDVKSEVQMADVSNDDSTANQIPQPWRNPRLPTGGEYGPENLRRSKRLAARQNT